MHPQFTILPSAGIRAFALIGMAWCAVLSITCPAGAPPSGLALWYDKPAGEWMEALPVGNGRLGGMIFGGVECERLQLNEDSVSSGSPQDSDNPDALTALPEIRQLLFAGKYTEANALAIKKLICKGAGSGFARGANVPFGCYQTLGDLTLKFDAHGQPADYRRTLDLEIWDDGKVSAWRISAAEPREVTVRVNGETKTVMAEQR